MAEVQPGVGDNRRSLGHNWWRTTVFPLPVTTSGIPIGAVADPHQSTVGESVISTAQADGDRTAVGPDVTLERFDDLLPSTTLASRRSRRRRRQRQAGHHSPATRVAM